MLPSIYSNSRYCRRCRYCAVFGIKFASVRKAISKRELCLYYFYIHPLTVVFPRLYILYFSLFVVLGIVGGYSNASERRVLGLAYG